MAIESDRSGKPSIVVTDMVMLDNVMRATGVPRDVVESFMMTDDDLDGLCESVLSELAVPTKKTPAPGA